MSVGWGPHLFAVLLSDRMREGQDMSGKEPALWDFPGSQRRQGQQQMSSGSSASPSGQQHSAKMVLNIDHAPLRSALCQAVERGQESRAQGTVYSEGSSPRCHRLLPPDLLAESSGL